MRLTLMIPVIALLLGGLPVWAQTGRSIRVESLDSQTPNGKPAAALVVNGKTVAQICKEQRGLPPQRCIALAAALVAQAYRQDRLELAVERAEQTRDGFALLLNGQVLLLATDLEGKAWGAPSEDLAQTWHNNLAEAWLAPAIPEPLVERPAPVSAAKPQPAPARASGGTVDTRTDATQSAPETEELTVQSYPAYDPSPSPARHALPAVPRELNAVVTGNSLKTDKLLRSVENAIRCYVGLPADANLTCTLDLPDGTELNLLPGQAKLLPVKYNVDGPYVEAREGQVSVTIEHRSIATPRESYTYFSNRPEGVKQPQLLYSTDLPAQQAARLVFHHQNQGPAELQFVARILNTSGSVAAVHVIPGAAAPDINTFYVGFKSAEDFWRNLNSGSGYVLKIPAGGQAYLTGQRLARGFTASGYYKLTNLGDTPLRIETLTLRPGTSAPVGPSHDSAGANHSVYPDPYYTVTAAFETGDPWLYLRLGGDNPDSVNQDGTQLQGSYGMTYNYSVELRNTRGEPALVFVLLRGSAGEVKGQFYIDGEYISTALVGGGDETMLKEIPLKVGETRLLRIQGLPLNGGFYPASIILRESRLP